MIANSLAKQGKVVNFALLDETDKWSDEYFAEDSPKRHRREMFFADRSQSWTGKAPGDPSPFSATAGHRRVWEHASIKVTGRSGAKKMKSTAVNKKKKAAPKRAAATKKSAVKKATAKKPHVRKAAKRKR